MDEKDDLFKEKVKNAFLRIKEDILTIKNEINNLNEKKREENDKINDLMKKIDKISSIISIKAEKTPFSDVLDPFISDGNEHARTHARTRSHEHARTHAITQSHEPQNIEEILSILTKKEILIFLTIPQLEDEGFQPTHELIAKTLKITPGCVRGYVSSLIRKGMPIHKEKKNNKLSLLSIKPSFKALNLKSRLIALYYQGDPSQLSLLDSPP